jgi:tRNA pseudouridine65 synthase
VSGRADSPRSVSPLEILHRDATLVAVTKPGGMLVHRTEEARHDRVFLLQTLARQVGRPLYPVHRLDRAASGAIVFGLSSEDAHRLHQALKAPDARKEYLVLVRGSTPDRWESDRPLTNRRGERRESRSAFEKIAEFSRLTLLRARIYTGRRHQIRRHLHHAAHQVLGDTTYGKGRINRFFREEYGLPRMFLHASTLAFTHPETGRALCLRSRLPHDLRAFLERLPDCDRDLVATL